MDNSTCFCCTENC